ncbi:putative late blight resistance protein homolog R1B-17 [Andrographis paniculata]|uniref:putative late blight resistance protein homolog R1B-17 n=1 Tax=Andrographis paniculata TaxID=175694 RepID=UPI0021E76F34|nr:putative late blight resistance protein homolog R1B-17 [Andrographis paniculata]XP_051115861.1 putative late blight resistance protein homolog R1B-17 [Andrographis paniculata]XP_051115862.1 putative late blight resistance protein homolog R1B-17 [Andrographis paniculata]
MAVAAYASLLSITHLLNNLHYRASFNLPRVDNNQVEALQEHVSSLLEFVELHSERKSSELQGLWKELAEVSTEAEGAINFHIANLLYAKSQGETSDTSNFSALCEEMETLIKKFCSIKKELSLIEEGEDNQSQKQPTPFVPAGGSSAASSHVSNVVVGLDEHVDTIRNKLIRGSFNLQILPIVGMGGIGKTTLAKSVFDDRFVVDHFDLLIWLSISQQYSVEHILKVGLGEMVLENQILESLDALGTRFYQKLFGRRYLIVMDDMWTTGAWDDLRRFFPNNENGSRILLTTRLSDMAASLGSYDPYMLTFLDEDKSWNLFCQSTFSKTFCPYSHLERFAKDIAKSCRGLPLAIIVVGRVLANSDMTAKHWENIGKSITSLANLGDDEHCMTILSLSYKSLPIHLKQCFLYMRVFREDELILISRLISSWIVEGFIKPSCNRSLEDIANEYVRTLINRNLIFANGTLRCGIHDLLRDLCSREYENEGILQFPRAQNDDLLLGKARRCSLCYNKVKDDEAGTHVLKPFHVFGSSSQVTPSSCGSCKMVYSRVEIPTLVKIAYYNDDLEKEKLQPIELRHVSLDEPKLLSPSTLHILWNIQSLRIRRGCSLKFLPQEIWEMPQLRNIVSLYRIFLPDPIVGKDVVVLKNLHSIDGLSEFKCTDQVIARIPNLKHLNVRYRDNVGEVPEEWDFFLYNLCQLQKLESLWLKGCVHSLSLPNSLKELHLKHCGFAWEDMSIVGSLPALERLEIIGVMKGSEWEPVQGEFLCLKDLTVKSNNLVCWAADAAHFPILERLTLYKLHLLEEIPSSIGDIPTLKSIIVKGCSDSVVESVKQIWEEQHEMGNDITVGVVDKNWLVRYQVGTFTARMTGAACESLAYLKCLREILEEVTGQGGDSLDTKQVESMQEDIHFLKHFVKYFHVSKSQEMESLLEDIEQAVQIGAALTGRLHSDIRDGVKILLDKIDFIKDALSVEKEDEHGEDVQDNDATSYDINSLGIIMY